MRKKTTLFLLILTLSIYASNINVQISAEENNYRPSSLELTPHESIEITSDGNFTDYGFPGTGTVEDPYVIEGYNITTTSNVGIYITDTTKYFTVRNCYVDAEEYGIYIDDVVDGKLTVINNTCSNNNQGIYLYYSGSTTVANNTCSNNNFGISLEDSANSTVTNNTCSNNNQGIYLYQSEDSKVVNNNCNNNIYGIHLHRSSFCVLSYNLLQENEGYGVCLSQISWGNIKYNLLILQENEGYGEYSPYSCDNNLIHHNNFVDNNLGGTSQGYDDGQNNYWYDIETLEGNYWSDWSGRGSYSIACGAGSEDLYPLDEPAEYSTDETQLSFTFTLLLVMVPLLLTRMISKKTKKN